jgi:hypothetical protein
VRFCVSCVELNLTRRPGSRYGSGRRKTELITLKRATFAPIPRPRPTMAINVNHGDFMS